MESSVPAWATIVLTALGGTVGAWLLNMYNARNKNNLDASKQTSDIRISENEQAFKIYKEIVDGLKIDVKKLAEDLQAMERDHLTCREENAGLKAEIRNNTREIEYLKSELSKYVKG